MPFSMPSYLLGVGTVVGALTLGFGGGVLLTKTAIKEPSGLSRMERAARAEPTQAVPVVTEAKAVPVPRAEPQPAVQPPPQVQAAAAPSPQAQPAPAPQVEAAVASPQVQPNLAAAKPVVEAKRDEPPQAAEPVKQEAQPVRQTEAPKQMQQREAESPLSARELRRAEREQRRVERRAERERHYAERRARVIEFVRMRQRPVEERDQPARPELAFEREQPKPNLFEGLFGRAPGAAPGDGRE
jgi:hypothetical protein